ncbi:hypothetical protein, partial [Amycolatopsis nivea]|uniref:hypothetical protein n=1 Tax=Amycolatopsis nivea TaxID=1644109 RepID=UPI0014302FE1
PRKPLSTVRGEPQVRILERFETDLASALRAPTPDLGTTIDIYVDSVVRNISRAGNVLRQHIAETRTELQPEDPALSALAAAQRLLLDAASGHVGEVRRSDPITALSLVARTVLGACVQRALAGSGSPDGLSWDRWRDEIADMTIGYLTRPTSA